jgi:hypothetical protein
MSSRRPHRGALALGATVALLALAAVAARADDRLTLDVRVGRQIERYQSREADSLGLSVTTCTVATLDCNFRVLDLPLQKTMRPTLEVFGTTTTSQRVFVSGATMPGAIGRTIESPMLDLVGGLGLSLPLGLVDGTHGANLRVRYEGGVVIASDSGENFLERSAVHADFERVGGVFDGTLLGVGYGHDDLYGAAWAAKRWSARMRVFAGIGRAPREAPRDPKAPPVAEGRRPLRAFLDLSLDTDGRPGPDRVGLVGGLALDVGSLWTRAGVAVGTK